MNKRTIGKPGKAVIVLIITAVMLSGCTVNVSVTKPDISETQTAGNNSLIRPRSTEHEYVHGKEGYYNLLEDGVDFKLVSQLSGTCWICAASCAMTTGCQKLHGKNIVFDQIELLREVYDDDKEEGVFISEGTDKKKFGGAAIFVLNELSRGFGDGLAVDGAVDAQNWTIDEVKEGIRRYGALYIGVPDTNSYKGNHDRYYTMNTPSPDMTEFDHSIAVLGWDDDFPKEYFNVEASRNGAWITYNSNYPLDYIYVSYDTPFDQLYDTPFFLSVTDRYPKVLSHDCGCWQKGPVSTGDMTVTANVFNEKGTLGAVGTYVLADDQDLLVQIMTPDLTKCLYSQKCHADHAGYHVFELDNPIDVEEYAVAVSYPKGASVEGESMDLEKGIHIGITSRKGQSYIQADGVWLDMSEKSTWDQIGCVTNNACIKALYITPADNAN